MSCLHLIGLIMFRQSVTQLQQRGTDRRHAHKAKPHVLIFSLQRSTLFNMYIYFAFLMIGQERNPSSKGLLLKGRREKRTAQIPCFTLILNSFVFVFPDQLCTDSQCSSFFLPEFFWRRLYSQKKPPLSHFFCASCDARLVEGEVTGAVKVWRGLMWLSLFRRVNLGLSLPPERLWSKWVSLDYSWVALVIKGAPFPKSNLRN